MQAVVVTVGPADVEVASDELWALGVVAVEERSVRGSVSIELWTSLGDDLADITDALAALRWPWRFETVDESVSETWREHAGAVWVADDLVVHPEWVAAPEGDGIVTIAIEPGATFGLGDHPTTVLSMLALRDEVDPGDAVLDVGCGSGVLSVAACRFGAAHIDAIDISPAAVPTTRHNARINGVEDRIDVSTTPLADIAGTYRVVVANILAPALIELAAELQRVLDPHGSLIISGILAERHDHVLAALQPLRVVARRDRDGWTAITLRR
ncbi:MAG: prmA [Ilumatobacteraceae bacterium]|nr:prmA [Ilumatobacteraceae bacterium]